MLFRSIAEKAFKDAKVPLVTLTNYEAVLDVALRTGYIEEEDIATLNEWRKDQGAHPSGSPGRRSCNRCIHQQVRRR